MEQFYSCAMPVGVHVLPKFDLESRLGDALGTSKSTHCIPCLRQPAPVVLHVRTEAVGARARARFDLGVAAAHRMCCCFCCDAQVRGSHTRPAAEVVRCCRSSGHRLKLEEEDGARCRVYLRLFLPFTSTSVKLCTPPKDLERTSGQRRRNASQTNGQFVRFSLGSHVLCFADQPFHCVKYIGVCRPVFWSVSMA